MNTLGGNTADAHNVRNKAAAAGAMFDDTADAAADDAIEAQVAAAIDEFAQALRHGDAVDAELHARRYPEIAWILRQLLPAVEAMHPAKAEALSRAAAPYPRLDRLGVLGDFRLLREIGRGGMGVVYEADQISLGRQVALKVLPLAAALDPRQLQRFRVEAQAAAHLHHAHIVPVYSVGCEQGVYYYAMQRIEGRSLAELIEALRHQRGLPSVEGRQAASRDFDSENTAATPEPELARAAPSTFANRREDNTERAEIAQGKGAMANGSKASLLRAASSLERQQHVRAVVRIGIQAAEALDFAHSMGVVHRDIKPGNLLLNTEQHLYVADFGLAQLRGAEGVSMTGSLLGTAKYMSPEQAQARRGVMDHRTDIYSLGATLYELLTLRAAFEGSDREELLNRILKEEPLAPRALEGSIPVDVETIVLKAMSKSVELRYATAKDMADDLRAFLDHRPIAARRPTMLERIAKWSRRHRSIVVSGVGLLILATIGFGIAYQREAQERARAQQSFQQARELVDFFTELSEQELVDKPEMQELRRKVLQAALKYYQDFIAQSRPDAAVAAQLAASHLRVANILDEIGSRTDALASLEEARVLQEKLLRTSPGDSGRQRALLSIYSRFSALRGGRELSLLMQQSVQDELRLSPSQIELIAKALANRREALRIEPSYTPREWEARFTELAAHQAQLGKLLTPEQSVRLEQIALQRRGSQALDDADVAQALQLSDDQRKRISLLLETLRSAWASARWDHWNSDDRKQLEESSKLAAAQIVNVLNSQQQKAWEQLIGPPFKGEITFGSRDAGFRHGPFQMH